MEIIKDFGVDPLLLTAQIANFLIIFFVLKKFDYKPILEVLKKREKTIKEGLADAEEGRKILDEAQEKEKEILQKAQKTASEIKNEAQQQASEILKAAGDKARKETEQIALETRLQIEKDYDDTKKRLAVQVSEVAIEYLEKSLGDLFGESKQKELMQIAMKKMKKN